MLHLISSIRYFKNFYFIDLILDFSTVFPVVQIVTFDNGPCQTTSGEVGSCYSQKECSAMGGTASGTCAKGFGICCVGKLWRITYYSKEVEINL